jgi:hypothetical protein
MVIAPTKAALEREADGSLDLLMRLVPQLMQETNGVYFSGFIRVNADLLEFLVQQGLMEAVGDRCDRDFSARFRS